MVCVAGAVVCIWIDVVHEMASNSPPFRPISEFFGLWHEHRRGAHRGLHKFYFQDKLILLLNIKFFSKKMGSYAALKPATATILQPQAFNKRLLAAAALTANEISQVVEVAAPTTKLNCDQV
jgi:hypothetical protein